ncbi:ATP-binding response regulator [Halohasta salina]|uniref:ATP-binding response regulator n=1 Tax=Halohasta salina TaxID=2961621 RepID=UPI0020A466FD|nr:hybrid sensor histidine kinase/response regulator [Halohasta salina]
MTTRNGGSHLLYADPDPIYRRQVSSVFEPEWTVTAVATADEAIEHLDESIDAVAAADDLPETGGIEFYRSVTTEVESVPFVLFAATEDVDRLRRAFRAGVDDVIYKQRAPGTTKDAAAENNSGGGRAGDITDGIVGLRNSLESVEEVSADLNGITLDVSRSLMGAAPDEVDMKTEWALKSLAEEIDATQCLIYEVDDDRPKLELTHGWTGDLPDDEIHRAAFDLGSESIPTERFPGFDDQLSQFEPACIDATRLEDAGERPAATGGDEGGVATVGSAAASVATDRDEGTLLALPVVIEWQLSGTIVITVDQPREWGEDARQRLQAVGELVGHMERRRRQRQALERQNEQLEQFASVISHDLQNPLNVISGYLDLAVETGDVSRLDPAVDAADRMSEMLDDLLTLAREGRAVGETEPVELEPIVEEAWENVETHDASLETAGFEALDPVEADASRLQEAFENLFKNAIVHAGEDVDMRVEADGGTVYVADDGPGIPADKRDVVFEYGHTGGDGTGLGLAIVRSIIEGHDWEIDAAESAEGGARFDIDLGR